MIEIRFTPPKSLDISGSLREMESLHHRLQEHLKSESLEVIIDADTSISPWPYQRVLKRMIILKNDGPMRVSVLQDDIIIEGDMDDLDAFISYLDFPLNAEAGYHFHFEYFEGNNWIHLDSVPLVIGIGKGTEK